MSYSDDEWSPQTEVDFDLNKEILDDASDDFPGGDMDDDDEEDAGDEMVSDSSY